jgi:putative DNA primase/helicase
MFVDFDHVFDPSTKTFDKTALEDILSLQTYAEMSPSGTGAHALGISEKVYPRKRTKGIELYNDMRFFTLTGLHINITCDTINKITDENLDELYNKRFSDVVEIGASNKHFELEMPKFEGKLSLKDSSIISLCSDVFTYTYFRDLWNGDWKEKFESQSEADIFLCSLLSTFTFNPFQLDRLFRKSKLYRPKWDEYRGKFKYSELTIYKVITENIRGGVYALPK